MCCFWVFFSPKLVFFSLCLALLLLWDCLILCQGIWQVVQQYILPRKIQNWPVTIRGNSYLEKTSAGIGTEWWTLSQDKTIISAWLGLEGWLHICILFSFNSKCSNMHTENGCLRCGMHLQCDSDVVTSLQHCEKYKDPSCSGRTSSMASDGSQASICQINQINSSLHNWQLKRFHLLENMGNPISPI